jgi:hypothetical protein
MKISEITFAPPPRDLIEKKKNRRGKNHASRLDIRCVSDIGPGGYVEIGSRMGSIKIGLGFSCPGLVTSSSYSVVVYAVMWKWEARD